MVSIDEMGQIMILTCQYVPYCSSHNQVAFLQKGMKPQPYYNAI